MTAFGAGRVCSPSSPQGQGDAEEETVGAEAPEVEWPTTVNAGEHATLRGALATASGGQDRESYGAPDAEREVVDVPLPDSGAGEAR